jgi:nucleoside-diphosphate-sugar epimerase/predicted dehydrogenase
VRFVGERSDARVVALADPNLEAARELAGACGAETVRASLDELLEATPLDVVHVLTPPQHHHPHALAALEHGAHVLLEKPCTLRAAELEELYRRADGRGLTLCPDFIHLFHPLFRRLASRVESGRFGRVVHVDACMSPDLDVGKLSEGTGLHWSFDLPGGLLHNFITHPLYLALHFLGPPTDVRVSAQSRGTLPRGLTDHLSISLEAEGATGHVLLSSAPRTRPYFLRVFCEEAVLTFDLFSSSLTVTRTGSLPRFVQRATADLTLARQLGSAAVGNVFKVLGGKLKAYQGLGGLIEGFYTTLRSGQDPPISRELALAVTAAEETVFSHPGRWRPEPPDRRGWREPDPAPEAEPGPDGGRREKVLVTGAAGYVGRHVVRRLVEDGHPVRVLARPLSRIEELDGLGVEVVAGDVRDLDGFERAARGVDVLVHLAAATRGGAEFLRASAVEGTRNAAEAARRAGVERVIYMSSMAVYDFLELEDGARLTEESPLEEEPEVRGAYSEAKRKAEDVALEHLEDGRPAWTILRPSVIVGGEREVTGAAGRAVGGALLCLGSPGKRMRLVHVDDVADAIARAIRHPDTRGRVFNLSDPGAVTLREYVRECVRGSAGRRLRAVYVPRPVAGLAFAALRGLHRLRGKGPNPDRRRLAYVYRNLRTDGARFEEVTGWRPPGDLLERLKGPSGS